jgi:PRC-barrel domain
MRLREIALATALASLAFSIQAAVAQTNAPDQPPATPTITPSPSPSVPPAAPASPQTAPGTSGTTSATAPATGAPASATRQLTVDAVEDMDLVASGSTEEIGEIEGVVEHNADKKQFVLIERGGFMGFGAKEIAIPLENLVVENDRLVLRSMDVAQLDGMPEFENGNDTFRELDDAQQVTLATQQ